MARNICLVVGDGDRRRLASIAADRNRPQKHIQRARIVPLSAERLAAAEVARQAGVGRPAVWRWQMRYAEAGVGAPLRDRTRPPGRMPLSTETLAGILALACSEPPGQVTHRTARAMAKAVGVSLRPVQRIWDAHRLQPHRLLTFKRSNDPAFAEKVEDSVGLTMDPPMGPTDAHRRALHRREEPDQALDRTRPGLPLKPGKCGTMTHDHKRDGVTILFAALNVQDATVLGRCMAQHRHQEFVRFLNAVERAVPPGKLIHAIADNYATHKHPKVRAWLERHPRWIFHFTPTSASWINAVEGFFSTLTRQRLRRGVFQCVADLEQAITRTIREHNAGSRPFVRTKPADTILGKLSRVPAPSIRVSALEHTGAGSQADCVFATSGVILGGWISNGKHLMLLKKGLQSWMEAAALR